ncbi:MAG: DUF5691 domain-containing protein [Planctomycetota bacterium]
MSKGSAEHPVARWSTLVNAATMGVDRVGTAALEPSSQDEPWIEPAPDAQPAELLLDQLSALSVYTTAGRTSEPIEPAWEPVADDLVSSNMKARSLLHTILHGRHTALLDEWCRLAGARGQRVPHELLAALLDEAVKHNRKRQDEVAAVLGSRGRWLAGQNKRWSAYAVANASEPEQQAEGTDLAPYTEQWETGSKGQRIESMTAMRTLDPGKAREALLASLPSESAVDRAAFARTLVVGLSAEDEPALEAMLDDRSSQVRDAAADLLSTITGSALSARMQARLESAVDFTPPKGKLRKKAASLALKLPSKLDDTAKRDGINDKAAKGMGAKATAISQVIGRTSLGWWTAQGIDAQQWVALALEGEWTVPLIMGWTQAAHLQADRDWSAALIDQVCLQPAGRRDPLNENWRSDRLEELIEHLDADQLHALVDKNLPRNASKSYPYRLVELLRACPGPWGVDLSRRVLAFLQQAVTNQNVVYDNTLRAFIDHVASTRLAIELSDSVSQGWPINAKHWSSNFEELIDRFIRTVALRQQMHDAFTE